MSVSQTEQRNVVESATEFGRVAVMFGGHSTERDVSISSGEAVLEALQSRDVDAVGWDPAEHAMAEFADAGFDRVWIALHGPGGEDGSLQGALQWLGTPYTGSGVMASAVAMDKIRSKHLFTFAGVSTPDYKVVASTADAKTAAIEFGYPLIIKPVDQGSSVGMSKVFEACDLQTAVELALEFGRVALVERCVVGQEITVAMLQGQPLPSIRIETPRVFYDYRAKYESDNTQYFCPATEDKRFEKLLQEVATAAFNELGCTGWGRVDFMVGSDAVPQVLEVNTVPGMTSHSLVPMAANAAGIDFAELCWRILETSVAVRPSFNAIGVAANDS